MPETKDETMRVWVGCLCCYNSGHLLGEWFDAIDAPEDMAEFNGPHYPGQLDVRGAHTSDDTECPHEELWVFDHENFGGLLTGECSPMEAKRIAELVNGVDNLDAFKAWIGYEGITLDDAALEQFQDAFCGEYESGADYARELADDMDAFSVGGSHGYYSERPTDISDRWPFTCIDWERAWRELEMGGDNFSVPTGAPTYGVYIFRSI